MAARAIAAKVFRPGRAAAEGLLGKGQANIAMLRINPWGWAAPAALVIPVETAIFIEHCYS